MSSLDKGLVIGNLLIQGYQAIKRNGAKAVDPNAKTVDSFCWNSNCTAGALIAEAAGIWLCAENYLH
jgi:hypothetical protein